MNETVSASRLSTSAYALLWSAMWLALMAAMLKFRPLLPVDETRYFAVAWEMWRDGHFLVPHLNGEPYSHKPPLLFWLMNAGWAVFGVNEWWPRLVAPLFGLASLFLTSMLARRLWPSRSAVAVAAPLILFACLFWTLFTTLTMFDMLLAFCALLAMLGILRAWQDNKTDGFVWLALAIGLGALAKGPAILLSTLPIALLAPLWAASNNSTEPEIEDQGLDVTPATSPTGASIMLDRGWKRWYIAVGFAVLGGVAIGLAWAIPAAIVGGDEYRYAIFWGQSAGRMVDSFAHGRPWWWFLAVLPGLVLPWTLWPAAWRSIRGLLDVGKDNGIRFCLIWFIPALITFSAISGKQLHYLLPVFPALALLFGRLLVDHHAKFPDQISWAGWGLHIPCTLFIVIGLAIAAAPFSAGLFELPVVVRETDFIWGLVLALLAVSILFLNRSANSLLRRLSAISILSMVLVLSVDLSLRPALAERFNMKEVSQKFGDWQRAGTHLAYVGKYHGQFNFLGRLGETIASIGLQDPDLEDWLAENPQGRVIYIRAELPVTTTPIHVQPYRGQYLIVLDTAQVLANPTILD
jgi:4-amino-4-deoxy-L-arabinose transferase-like glycosyltransferase